MKKRILIVLSIIIIGLLIFLTHEENRNLLFLEKIIRDCVFEINSVLAKEKNIELALEMKKNKTNNIDDELLELKKLLELKTLKSEYKQINATVVNRSMQFFYDSVIINKGSNDGIKENMAVITPTGLLGKIVNVSKNTSAVKLITSSDINNMLSIQIKTECCDIYGVLSAYDKKTNSFIVEGIDEQVEIKTGDIVSTTGFGSIYTSGILIGSVSRIQKDNFDLAYILKVTPGANFEGFKYVAVLGEV